MAAEDEGNFFSRWSRRKVQVRTGQPLPPEPPVAAPVPPSTAAAPVAPERDDPAAAPAAPAAESPPPLTLDDVASLTPDGDFKPFMARQVAPEVRNAAVKKLFTDPHFNVMDGLDIYIDDYSRPSPLSATDMAKMVGAQFLKLVDDPEAVKPSATPAAEADQPVPCDQPPAIDPPVAHPGAAPSPPNALAPASDSSEPTHDHADLQLQPDHAPERQGPGHGAG